MRLIFLITCMQAFLVQGQNLVSNPGFENHLQPLPRLQQATFLDNAEFAQTVQGWESFSAAYMSALFSTKYTPAKWQAEDLGYNFDKCRPHSGHSMIRIWVTPKEGLCGYGNGGGIQTKLIQPLEVSNIYSVSFWLFILKSDGTFYFPLFPKNFGMAFSDKKINGNPECTPVSDSPFTVDSVRTAEWYQVQYLIQPTKPLSNMAISPFVHPEHPYAFPKNKAGFSYYFFIDDIEVRKITDPDSLMIKKAISYPFTGKPVATLKFLPANPAPLNSMIYFANNSDSIDNTQRMVLDSIVRIIKQKKELVFSLNGYTDIIGHGNQDLSMRRASAVYQYLMQQGGFSSYQFELHAFGSDSAVADNRYEAGRQLNRRVEIKECKYSASYLLYRHASQYAQEGKTDSAFICLFEWLKLKGNDGMLLLHDPDLTTLHALPLWKKIEAVIKTRYKHYKYPEISYKLDHLYFKDQRFRSINQLYQKAKGYTPMALDTVVSLNTPTMRMLDSINAIEAVQYILEKSAWPDSAVVGSRQSEAVFFAIQHSRDLQKLKRFLPYLENACKSKKAPWEQYAMMFDRAMLEETGVQRYGTQYQADKEDPALFRLVPLDNPKEVDKIRAEIGMPPIDLHAVFRILGKGK